MDQTYVSGVDDAVVDIWEIHIMCDEIKPFSKEVNVQNMMKCQWVYCYSFANDHGLEYLLYGDILWYKKPLYIFKTPKHVYSK